MVSAENGGMSKWKDYVLIPNFGTMPDGEERPCILLKQNVGGELQLVWKQAFSDWVQRDATYNRLRQREDHWDSWGQIYTERGVRAFLDVVRPYFLDLDDIYPTDARPVDGDRICMWVARGDENNPLIFMVDMTSGSGLKIAELNCDTIPTRDWAQAWLMDQLNRCSTFFRILEEDGESGLQDFLDLIIAQLAPENVRRAPSGSRRSPLVRP